MQQVLLEHYSFDWVHLDLPSSSLSFSLSLCGFCGIFFRRYFGFLDLGRETALQHVEPQLRDIQHSAARSVSLNTHYKNKTSSLHHNYYNLSHIKKSPSPTEEEPTRPIAIAIKAVPIELQTATAGRQSLKVRF